eukprot:CAMPEP_0170566036 /NCGR_PEP_ID=MMETSP0211-20121228/79581_1 /TAXON_ID=311385 /ORGANISM="Pseudokeronopsis sp., Strain OXSARD2" /LENGTH=66 /DNA_ID=CAMNT_0010887095 /DNA_START=932 /DNA_END=1132 /DNA_ORIENTATION=-
MKKSDVEGAKKKRKKRKGSEDKFDKKDYQDRMEKQIKQMLKNNFRVDGQSSSDDGSNSENVAEDND